MDRQTSPGGLSWRLIDGPVNEDVTAHIDDQSITWALVGGCSHGEATINLPPSTFPTIDRENARLIAYSPAGEAIWEGFVTDPGVTADDEAEYLEVGVTGSMMLASLRLMPLVYLDAELDGWQQWAAATEQHRFETDTTTNPAAPVLSVGFGSGYPVGAGSISAADWVRLTHSEQAVGSVSFTVQSGVTTGWVVDVVALTKGTPSTVASWAASTAATARTVTLPAGTDTLRVQMRRTGAATNVATDTVWTKLTNVKVSGARVDRYGAAATGTAPLKSADIVADLIGRGMLGPVDAAGAVIEDSGVELKTLAWPEGVRGSAVLDALREQDPGMTWQYGVKGERGYEFGWVGLSTAARYDVLDVDAVTWQGDDIQPCQRVRVVYTDAAGVLRSTVVALATEPGELVRDADPITLDGTHTEAEAIEEGMRGLAELANPEHAATVGVDRLVFDRTRGIDVEPYETRPGSVRMPSGDVMVLNEVTWDADGAQWSVGTEVLSDAEKIAALIRGQIEPGKPPIVLPESKPSLPQNAATNAKVDAEIATVNASIQADLAEVNQTILNGDSANAQAIDAAVNDFNAGLATKSKHTLSPNAPGTTANNAGDVWEQHKADDATKIIARYRGQGGTSWTAMNLDATYIPLLDIGSGTFGDLDGVRIKANSIGVTSLTVADFTNFVRDPRAQSSKTWTSLYPWALRSGLTATPAGTTTALNFTADGTTATGFASEDFFPVTPGDRLYLRAFVRRRDIAATQGTVSIRYHFYYEGGSYHSNLVASVNLSTLPAFGWTLLESPAAGWAVPTDATKARVLAWFEGTPNSGVEIQVTDIVARRKMGGELIVDGGILARHVTADMVSGLLLSGRVIQTNQLPNRGIKMSDSGFIGYDASGTPTFSIDPSTGSVAMKGTLTSGSTITGAILEGVGIRTNTGINDVEIVTNSGAAALWFKTQANAYNGVQYYDNSDPGRVHLYNVASGGVNTWAVRLQGAKATTSTTTPRIDITTQRTQSSGAITASIAYHAGYQLGGDPLYGVHQFYVNGNPAMRIGVGGIWSLGNTGFNDDQYIASAGQNAIWNSSGRIVRGSTSSLATKKYVTDLDPAEAYKFMDLRSVRFKWRADQELGDAWQVGHIVEEADALGMDLWIYRDADGKPTGFKYAEEVAAHNVILRDHDAALTALTDRIAALEGATP